MKKIVLAVCLVILCSSITSILNAQEADSQDRDFYKSNLLYDPHLISVGANLGYLFGDDLNLIGSAQFDFPFIVKNEKSTYINLHLSSSLLRKEGASFKVYDTDYQITLGARDYFTRKIIISAFMSQQGTERADAEGSPYIRFIGFSMESSDYRKYKADQGLYWYSEIGAIFKKREVEAEITFKADLRWNYLVTDRASYGLDFKIDSLIDDFNTSNDWFLGPRISFCSDCPISPSIFLYYINSNNPLGIGEDGFILGFDYRDKKKSNGFKKILPEINGNLSAGVGEGREDFHFGLKFRSPNLSSQKSMQVVFEFDQHMLTASETGDLYYFLFGGLEFLWIDLVPGAYFYHRSNHQLGEPNDHITSRNVFEVGISTKGWDRKNISDGCRIHVGFQKNPALFNFLLRGGYLISSKFGETRRWNIQSGARFDFPFEENRYSAFFSAFWEGGEVSRKEFHLGIRTPLDLDLSIVYKKDEQYFAKDKDLFLLEATLLF